MFQKWVQANHMNSLSISHCRSKSWIINKEISLYKYVDIISIFFMGLLYGTHLDNPHMGLLVCFKMFLALWGSVVVPYVLLQATLDLVDKELK